MKVTFFSFLFLAASFTAVHGQTPADSGKWPWKLPFEINLSASFVAGFAVDTYYNQSLHSETTYNAPDFNGFEFDVDHVTTDSIAGKVVTLNFDDTTFEYSEYTFNKHLSIIFDLAFDSIITLSCSFDETYNGNWTGFQSWCNFTFSGLRFDSSSIIYPDTSLSHVQFDYANNSGESILGSPWVVQSHESSLQLLGITLAGIFQPATLTAPASVANTNQNQEISLQSYPNPFSQSTTISFTPHSSGYADVSIVNLLGSEVSHLFSGELAAGEHSFVWSNPTGLPDGTYECLVRMNGQMGRLPMVLMR